MRPAREGEHRPGDPDGVLHPRLGAQVHLPAGGPKPAREVHLLEVEEVRRVEAAHVVQRRAADEEAGALDVADLAADSVLRGQPARPAEPAERRRQQRSQLAAQRGEVPGRVARLPFGVDARAHDGARRVAVQPGHQQPQVVGGEHGVRVEEQHAARRPGAAPARPGCTRRRSRGSPAAPPGRRGAPESPRPPRCRPGRRCRRHDGRGELTQRQGCQRLPDGGRPTRTSPPRRRRPRAARCAA